MSQLLENHQQAEYLVSQYQLTEGELAANKASLISLWNHHEIFMASSKVSGRMYTEALPSPEQHLMNSILGYTENSRLCLAKFHFPFPITGVAEDWERQKALEALEGCLGEAYGWSSSLVGQALRDIDHYLGQDLAKVIGEALEDEVLDSDLISYDFWHIASRPALRKLLVGKMPEFQEDYIRWRFIGSYYKYFTDKSLVGRDAAQWLEIMQRVIGGITVSQT